MSLNLNDEKFDFECPNCNQTIITTIGNVGKTIKCIHCGQEITLQDDGISQAIKNIDNQINDIFKNFK